MARLGWPVKSSAVNLVDRQGGRGLSRSYLLPLYLICCRRSAQRRLLAGGSLGPVDR